ncbi:MAG: PAS domain-containing sensor histidine kinase [Prolixibacteraceae bacterium]
MAYKSYNRVLLFRLILIVLLPAFAGWHFAIAQQWGILSVILLLELILCIELVRFLNKTNQQIAFFIQSIKNEDTTLRFPLRTGNSILDELHKSLNELNIILQETKVKGQIKEQYFSEIIQNIGTGILVLNERGFISDVNPATMELLGVQTLTHLKQLDRVDPGFAAALWKMRNKQKQMLILKKKSEQVQIVTRCTVINLKEEEVRLITMQDIRGELERKEIDSWIKLIRVMSHEIMNSLAPVTSIAQSLKRIWREKLPGTLFQNDDDIESTINGLDVIAERGEALKRFVQSYRILTHVPQPNCRLISVHAFVDSLNILLSPLKEDSKVVVKFHYPEKDFNIKIDEQLLIQVIINLVKNSVEAIGHSAKGQVDIKVEKPTNGEVKFEIMDNGPGIPNEVLDQIFVPFFTTKEGGTGVGLSHSRQIIRAHGGSIQCHSVPGRTVFVIEV